VTVVEANYVIVLAAALDNTRVVIERKYLRNVPQSPLDVCMHRVGHHVRVAGFQVVDRDLRQLPGNANFVDELDKK